MTGQAEAAARNWFLNTAEGAAGPYTAVEIRTWLDEGRITDEWYVWREGTAAWTLIRETHESFPVARSGVDQKPLDQENPSPKPAEKAAPEEHRPAAKPQGPGFIRRLFLAAETMAFNVRSGIQWFFSFLGKLIYPVFVLVLVIGLGYAQVHVWKTPKEFRSPSGGYSVVLPGFYSKVSTDEQNSGGMKVVSHEAMGGGTMVDLINLALPAHRLIDFLSTSRIIPPIRVFGMGHLEMPRGLITRQNREEVLTSMVDDFVKAFEGKISTRETITLGKYPGQGAAFAGTYEGEKIFGRVRTYIAGNRAIFVLFAGLVEGAINDPAGEEFFQSLKLVD